MLQSQYTFTQLLSIVHFYSESTLKHPSSVCNKAQNDINILLELLITFMVSGLLQPEN